MSDLPHIDPSLQAVFAEGVMTLGVLVADAIAAAGAVRAQCLDQGFSEPSADHFASVHLAHLLGPLYVGFTPKGDA